MDIDLPGGSEAPPNPTVDAMSSLEAAEQSVISLLDIAGEAVRHIQTGSEESLPDLNQRVDRYFTLLAEIRTTLQGHINDLPGHIKHEYSAYGEKKDFVLEHLKAKMVQERLVLTKTHLEQSIENITST